MTDPTPPARRGRLALIGLAALFFVPLAVSFYLYFYTDWRPSGGAQKGELISPPRPLPAGLPTGDWLIVHLGEGSCDESCRETLIKTRQVRLALDKDVNRVSRVFLRSSIPAIETALGDEHPDLLVRRTDDEAGRALLAAFPAPPSSGRIYLVDPLGNLLMAYPADAPPRSILTDLERLLKLSHIG